MRLWSKYEAKAYVHPGGGTPTPMIVLSWCMWPLTIVSISPPITNNLGTLTTPMSRFLTVRLRRLPEPPSSPNATLAELTFSGHYPIASPLFPCTAWRAPVFNCPLGILSQRFFLLPSCQCLCQLGVRILLYLGWGDMAHCHLCRQEQGVLVSWHHYIHHLRTHWPSHYSQKFIWLSFEGFLYKKVVVLNFLQNVRHFSGLMGDFSVHLSYGRSRYVKLYLAFLDWK